MPFLQLKVHLRSLIIVALVPVAAAQDSKPALTPSNDDGRGTFRIATIAEKRVARVGTHEITIGEILKTAANFYPDITKDFDSGYGEQFLASEEFDKWIDAYIDLLVIKRDSRIHNFLPPKNLLDAAFVEHARLLAPRSVARLNPNPASRPANAMNDAAEQVRRMYGFEVARNVQLHPLVPPLLDHEALRLELVKSPKLLTGLVRARSFVIATREPGARRFDRERRLQIASDAERVAARLRQGESFLEVAAQVTGSTDSRSKDTMPWISQKTPLPVAVLRALFKAKEGEIVGPIEVFEGLYIAKVEEIGNARAEEFTTVVDTLSSIIRRDEEYDLLMKLKREVEIVIY
ncbi:MAG: peptidylprolyl isomerase [Planctomycetota bacterium]